VIKVVVGPPCGGKSTYLDEWAAADEVRIDFDTLAVALGSSTPHGSYGDVRETTHAARAASVSAVLAWGADGNAWIVHANPNAFQVEEYEAKGVQFYLLNPGLDECLARAEADERPEDTADLIRNWYDSPPTLPATTETVSVRNKLKGMPMLKQKLHAPLRIKSVSETGEFSGYGSVFNTEDSYGDVVVKGAFTESLQDWAAKGRMPSLLWQHDVSEPIGVYTRMEEDDEGLYVEGRLLVDDDPLAKRAHAHLKAGSLSGMSIGYSLPPEGWSHDKEKDIYVLSKINLWEVSLVTFPANDEARVSQVKSILSHGQTPNIRQVEHCLRDVGFSARQAKAFIADGYSGINLRDEGQDAELIKTISALTQSMRN